MNILPPKERLDEWTTPWPAFQRLNRCFNFTLDPCASDQNHKCEKYFTQADNGLAQSWRDHRVFMNPPYSTVRDWAEKAYRETRFGGCPLVCGLLASRPDSAWWHDFVEGKAWVRNYRGRIKFELPHEVEAQRVADAAHEGVIWKPSSPQFSSALIIWTEPLLRSDDDRNGIHYAEK